MSNHAAAVRPPAIQFGRLATLAYLAIVIACSAWYLCAHAGFMGDDIDHFVLLQKTDFGAYVLTPVTNHFAPMHRLLSWLVYSIAPMRFGVVVSVLLFLHACTIAYLYALLRKLGASEGMSQVLVCCYASCQLSLYGMIWWAHAQHRFPFLLCVVAAIYHYLAWLDHRRTRSLAIVVVAYVLALSAYEIAVLLPVYLIVFAALTRWDRLIADPLRNIGPVALLLLTALLYVAIYIHRDPGVAHQWNPTLPQTVVAMLQFAGSLAGSVLGMPEGRVGLDGQHPALAAVLVAAFWGTLFVLSFLFARLSWRAWLAGIAMLALSVLPIALSDRVTIFGNLLVSQYRYQFEYLYLIVLFAGMVATCWRKQYQGPMPPPFALTILAVVFVLAFAACNLAGLAVASRQSTGELAFARLGHAYMSNLRAGLEAIPERSPAFRNSMPPYFLAGWSHANSSREIVHLFVPDARFGPGFKSSYMVKKDGTIVFEEEH
jgi:hypothetical protein